MTKLYTLRDHDQLYQHWQHQRAVDLHVLHIDFHCDMVGLLVDRQNDRAYSGLRERQQLHEGNFLTQAILDGMVTGVHWVHDTPGGRVDDTYVVKYASDWSAYWPLQRLQREQAAGLPFELDVSTTNTWDGQLHIDQALDIDWDYFACTDYDADSIQARVDRFWDTELSGTPAEIYVCESWNYVHPSHTLYEQFVERLADRFSAEITPLPPINRPEPIRTNARNWLPAPLFTTMRNAYFQTQHALRVRGIF